MSAWQRAVMQRDLLGCFTGSQSVSSAKGASAFEVRMRHPDGRAAGEAYLKQLAEMPKPFANEKPERAFRFLPNSDPLLGPWPNPETPQFLPGTMWALAWRAILADTKGMPVVSPMVESVQLRVYRTLEAQTFFEWETRHALLLRGVGFHLTKPEDEWYGSKTFRPRRLESYANVDDRAP